MLVVVLLVSNYTPAQIISTIAGTGSGGYSGDGGAATAAQLSVSGGHTVSDAAGNLYIADGANNRIRKINRAGIISTIAGTGSTGYSGDGGPATAAQLSTPVGIAIDGAGNLFFTDVNNIRVRKINTSGIITTIAGNGTAGYSGDGGPATAAQFRLMYGIAVDNTGRVIIADGHNSCVRRIDTSGIITTIAGTGTAGYSGDGGAATAALLSDPTGIAIDRVGNVYVCDADSNCVRVIYPYGMIATIAGTGSAGFSGDSGPATAAQLAHPLGIAVTDSGYIYIADFNNNRIRKINLSGIISTAAGTGSAGYSGDGGPATAAQLNGPISISFDRSADASISDHNNSVVRHLLLNYAPAFTNGHHQVMSVCESSAATSINSLLAAIDSEAGQIERWAVVAGPPHGYLSATYTATATGSAITPTGLTYAPVGGYHGADTFSVSVSDGFKADTTTIVVTVIPLPLGGYIMGADSTCPGAYDTLSNLTGTPGGTWSHTDTFVNISTSGVLYGRYPGSETVIYSVTTVCGTATASLHFTVNNAPFSGAIIGADSVCVGATTVLTNPTATPGGTWTSSDTTVAGINATGVVLGRHGGSTYIHYNAHSHCGSAPAVHRVNVMPNEGIITGADSVCNGAAITLTDTIPSGIWSSSTSGIATVSSTGIVTGRAVGSATISYTVTHPTCGSATARHTVYVKALPNAGTITGAASVCARANTTLGSTVSGGLWSSTDTTIATVGAASGMVSGRSTGTATLSYAVTNSCGIAYTSVTFTVNDTPVVSAISGTDSVCMGATVVAASAPASGTWSLSNGHAALLTGTSTTRIISGISAGYDTLKYSVTNSCGSTAQSKRIKILPSPIAGTITGTATVCEAAAITLSDTAAGGVWSATNSHATVASGVVNGITAGTDTIMYSVTNSCGTAIARHTVVINPLPVVAPIMGSTIICTGVATTLTDAATGGTWTANNSHATVASGVVTGLSIGLDTISYSITNSCGTVSAIAIITINPIATPAVNNSVSPDSIACSGDAVTFSAHPVNGGSSPYIRWIKSGVGMSTGITYAYVPVNGDAVHCIMVSNDACTLQDTVSSNTITMTITPTVTPIAIISPSPNDTIAFAGQLITFTTTLINCGSVPIYQWFLNGTAVSGATNATYAINVFTNDTVFCVVSCSIPCGTTFYNHTNTVVVCATPLAIAGQDITLSRIALYPNPNSREFYLTGQTNSLDETPISFEIADMPGRVLYRSSTTPQKGIINQKIHLDDTIHSGQYMLRLISNNGVIVLRFVVAD